MKVLWLVNIIMPELGSAYSLGEAIGGGWLVGLHEDLKKQNDIELVICCPVEEHRLVDEDKFIDGTHYYFFKRNVSSKVLIDNDIRFFDIIEKEKPDVIHIWGSEYLHGLQMYNAAEKNGLADRVVVSIQGLVSIYAHHFYAGIPNKVIAGKTAIEIIKNDNLKKRHADFVERGKHEIDLIKKVQYVIGRTDWDKACALQINRNLKYFKCNETLRQAFYNGAWNYDNCQKHSIFFSQCSTPLKGFHILLDAMQFVKQEYPDTTIYVTGVLKSRDKSFKNRMLARSYDRYLSKKIREYNLENQIFFMGNLNEEDMKKAYLKSNVFVLASSIENSPNSLGEAMILGTPVVASHVGGVTSMIKQNEEGYVFDVNAPYMLAYYICDVFAQENNIKSMTQKAKMHAEQTHNRDNNVHDLLNIYCDVAQFDLRIR